MWYLRESYTAFLCANLPLTYPLIQRIFKLKSWSHNSYSGRYLSGSLQRRTWRSGLRSQRKSHLGIKSASAHGGISKTISVNVSNTRSIPDLQRSESEERIYGPPTSRMFEQKSFTGADPDQQHLWVPSVTIEMGPVSPTSKDGSVMTAESIKSLDEVHVKQ